MDRLASNDQDFINPQNGPGGAYRVFELIPVHEPYSFLNCLMIWTRSWG